MQNQGRNLREHWNRLSALDPDRSIIDPNDSRGHKNRYLAGLRNQAFLESLQGMPPGALLLDYGCGSGSATGMLLNEDWRVIGMDISMPLLRQARQRCPRREAAFLLTDGRTLPLGEGAVAAALTYGVLIYCVADSDLTTLLMEFRRVLRPGGLLILVEQVKRRDHIAEHGLKRFRTIGDWRRRLGDAGFVVEHHTVLRHGRFPGTIALQRGLVPPSLWRGMARLERTAGTFGVLPWDYADVRFVAHVPAS